MMCSITDMNSWSVFSNSPECGTQTFTLLFAESIMTLLPTCLALILGALRLIQLRKGSYKARRERLYGSKMVTTHFYLPVSAVFRSMLNSCTGILAAAYSATTGPAGCHGSTIYSQNASLDSSSSCKLCFIGALYVFIRFRA